MRKIENKLSKFSIIPLYFIQSSIAEMPDFSIDFMWDKGTMRPYLIEINRYVTNSVLPSKKAALKQSSKKVACLIAFLFALKLLFCFIEIAVFCFFCVL